MCGIDDYVHGIEKKTTYLFDIDLAHPNNFGLNLVVLMGPLEHSVSKLFALDQLN